MGLTRKVKSLVRNGLERVALFQHPAFRLTLLDVLRRTPRLRFPESAFNVYVDWREEQLRRYGFEFYPREGPFREACQYYYGKVDRVSLVLQHLESVLQRGVEGEIAEFGVFFGFTAYALNHVLDQRKAEKRLYLFDSFQGLPEIKHEKDKAWKQGMFTTSEESVRKLFANSPRVTIVPGFFSETLFRFPDVRWSFCHIDCDLYTSIREVLEHVYPRLAPGGVLVFDDYGFRSCAGAKQAIAELFRERNEPFVSLPTGQAVFIAKG
jgi:hypothetical protein